MVKYNSISNLSTTELRALDLKKVEYCLRDFRRYHLAHLLFAVFYATKAGIVGVMFSENVKPLPSGEGQVGDGYLGVLCKVCRPC